MSDIFTLTIACVGGSYLEEDYAFVFEAPVALTLGELASHILDTVAFEDLDHPDDFYFANGNGGGRTGLTPESTWDDDNGRQMKLRLSEIYPAPKNKKLYYLFDYGASWCFQITKRGKGTKLQPGVSYPRIVSETGVKPKEFGDEEEDEQ